MSTVSISKAEDSEREKVLKALENMPEEVRESLLASITGLSPEDKKENQRVYEEAKKYWNLPISQWPEFEIRWDLKTENRRFALDGFREETYKKHYPNGLIAGWVDFKEFMNKLASHSQRTKEELWETSGHHKLARAILYFVEGNSMTPPLISHDDKGALIVGGGFHRLGVCLAKEIEKLPILVIPSEKEAIELILPSIVWE